MATYKAEWLVTKRQTLVFETDYPITDRTALNINADAAYKDEGPDKEELIYNVLISVQDITPPEEHEPEGYANWRVENGCVYFNSNKTAIDYQILLCDNKSKDIEADSYLFVIVELTHEASVDKYGRVIGQFICDTDIYVPDFNHATNKYIQSCIETHEQEQSSVSD